MEPDIASPLLGGLSPAQFMRRHWQKKPLLVRQALPGITPPLPRARLFELAARDGVESRLVQRRDGVWSLRHGPLPRRALPPLARPHWTLLVQGLDLHEPAAHALLRRFGFVPDARLDDLMLSYASDGGGVGPHLDSYDVFLIQVHGQRRWRIARTRDHTLVEGVPLKILRHFEPEQEWLLQPGDMLYLPPHWAHDGVAVGECMTASVGFRAAAATELARELLVRLADGLEPAPRERIYGDAAQPATATPAAMPPALQDFAAAALRKALRDPRSMARALGEWLTEPKAQVWFDAGHAAFDTACGVVLDRRTRMLYDARHVFINGESFEARGRDARLLHRLANQRRLQADAVRGFSPEARTTLDDWARAGWLRASEVGGS
ncbi:MAG TPA: cupin domain-containing protein [Rubrivivax sp.]|nr:cupin domain-containing protein [Rubrivivax sp.]